MELLTLSDLHAAQRGTGVIVITDRPTGINRVHRPDCRFVNDDYFTRKVIDGDRREGSYFAELGLAEAERAHRAVPCSICNP